MNNGNGRILSKKSVQAGPRKNRFFFCKKAAFALFITIEDEQVHSTLQRLLAACAPVQSRGLRTPFSSTPTANNQNKSKIMNNNFDQMTKTVPQHVTRRA